MDFSRNSIHESYEYKPQLTAFLYRCANIRCLVPSSLRLGGIYVTDKWPVSGGGFADIYKGQYRGEVVALKVIRNFSGTQGLEKVQLNHRNR